MMNMHLDLLKYPDLCKLDEQLQALIKKQFHDQNNTDYPILWALETLVEGIREEIESRPEYLADLKQRAEEYERTNPFQSSDVQWDNLQHMESEREAWYSEHPGYYYDEDAREYLPRFA